TVPTHRGCFLSVSVVINELITPEFMPGEQANDPASRRCYTSVLSYRWPDPAINVTQSLETVEASTPAHQGVVDRSNALSWVFSVRRELLYAVVAIDGPIVRAGSHRLHSPDRW